MLEQMNELVLAIGKEIADSLGLFYGDNRVAEVDRHLRLVARFAECNGIVVFDFSLL